MEGRSRSHRGVTASEIRPAVRLDGAWPPDWRHLESLRVRHELTLSALSTVTSAQCLGQADPPHPVLIEWNWSLRGTGLADSLAEAIGPLCIYERGRLASSFALEPSLCKILDARSQTEKGDCAVTKQCDCRDAKSRV